MKPVEVPEIADAVKKITASSKSTDISVAFDRGVFQSKNRYIVRLNASTSSAFNGTGYYTNSTNTVDNTSTLTRRNMTVKPGDTVSAVSLTAGSPG